MDQPVGSAGSQEVVDVQSGLGDVTDGVLVNLVATNDIIGSALVLVQLVDSCFVAGAGLQVGSVASVEVSSGNFGVVSGIDVLVLIGDLQPLGALIAFSVDCTGHAPQVVDIQVQGLACCQSVSDGSVTHSGQGLVGAFCIGVVVLGTASDCGLTCDVQVSTVVLHSGIQQSLHGVDVGISVDNFAVLPLHVGVQLDFEDEALLSLLSSLTGGQGNLILGQVVLMLSGNVADLISSDVDPLIDTVDGVFDGHGSQRSQDVGHHGILIVRFPSVGVPVVAQCGHAAMIGVIINSCQRASRSSGFGSIGLGSLSCFGSLFATGGQRQDHSQSQQHCQKLLHFVSSFNFSFTRGLLLIAWS